MEWLLLYCILWWCYCFDFKAVHRRTKLSVLMPERLLTVRLVDSRVKHSSPTAPQLTRHSSHTKSEIMV
jgi:hypothetical protein